MTAAAHQAVELSIGGMTCASCAARIEKKLNRLDGVTATVNFATEKAAVSFPGTVTPQDLIAVVERTGYRAALPVPPLTRRRTPKQRPAASRPPRAMTRRPRCASGCWSRCCSRCRWWCSPWFRPSSSATGSGCHSP